MIDGPPWLIMTTVQRFFMDNILCVCSDLDIRAESELITEISKVLAMDLNGCFAIFDT